MPERILILGGARFHGLQLAEYLVAAGNEVYVLNRGKHKTHYNRGIKHLIADRNDAGQLKAVLNDLRFDAVIDNNAYDKAQIERMLDLLCERCGHYIFTSTAAVYLALYSDHKLREAEAKGVLNGPYSPVVKHYALSKLAAEETLRQKYNDINYTIIRLPNIFGVGDFLGKLSYFYCRFRDGGKILLENEVGRFSLVCAKDAVRVMSAVVNNEKCFSKTINVADPATYNYEQFFSTIFGKYYSPAKVVFMPARDMWDAGYFLPLAWGPMVDTTLLRDLFDAIDFTSLDAWGKLTLEWELDRFGDRTSNPDFARARGRELELIESVT